MGILKRCALSSPRPFLLIFGLVFVTSRAFTCELVQEHFVDQDSDVSLLFDKCGLRNPKLVINYKNVKSPSDLRSHILDLLKRRKAIFQSANFNPTQLASALEKTSVSDWKLGRLDSTLCFDESDDAYICSHFVLMRYRVRKGKNRFKLLYNSNAVQFKKL